MRAREFLTILILFFFVVKRKHWRLKAPGGKLDSVAVRMTVSTKQKLLVSIVVAPPPRIHHIQDFRDIQISEIEIH